ncbi:MAG: MarR family transcriptional regulator [bacterium]|nr:MarR family transcriptional regulator [bacterium]
MSDETREMSEQIDRLMAAFPVLMSSMHRYGASFARERELSVAQFKALLLLEHHGPLSMSELAHLLSISPSTASLTTERMVKHNLVKRRHDLPDKRMVRVHLSAAGAAYLAAHREHARDVFRQTLERLSAEDRKRYIDAWEFLVHVTQKVTEEYLASERRRLAGTVSGTPAYDDED